MAAVAMLVSSLCGAAIRSPGHSADHPAGGAMATPQDEQPAAGNEYIGNQRCFTCHREQSASWNDTAHAKAFQNLPEKYRDDDSCLTCHVTAYGQPGGYVSSLSADEAAPFLHVGCESCHGPGKNHEQAVQRWTLSDPADEERLFAEMKSSIVRVPDESQCAACHTGQAHQAHPAYDGQPATPASVASRRMTTSPMVLPPASHSYSVKTCGSCHYEAYKQWSKGKHVDLSARLTGQYVDDQECLKCHQRSLAPWDWYTTGETQPAASNVGVGCESCHGPALKHVLYNRQFIAGPRLTPELEEAARQSIREGKPDSACLQCHIREAHQSHPDYESEAEEVAGR
jgi:hypothetical protein